MNAIPLNIKLNEIVNRFLLVGDTFMPEIHLKQPGFTYSACGPFTKSKERIKKFMQTGTTDFIYKNELDKACFQHDMAYGISKDLTKGTQSNNVLRVDLDFHHILDLFQCFNALSFKIERDPKYDGYQRGIASMIYKFFHKKSSGSGADASNQIMNWQMNVTGRLLKNSRDEKFIHLLETVFRVLV